jgi:RNA polymerase sigma-70 factor, ECF subfamily
MKESEQQHIFNTWLSQYKALLFKVVRAYAFTEFDRDDLFQEITIQVWHSIPKFRHESAVSTWLYRVSLNTAMRWSMKEKKHSDGRESIEGLPSAHPLLLQEQATHNDEKLAWLYAEIALLSEVERSLTLLLLDGFSYKEMADMVGLTETNIGVKIHRIKRHLTTQSKKYEHYGV